MKYTYLILVLLVSCSSNHTIETESNFAKEKTIDSTTAISETVSIPIQAPLNNHFIGAINKMYNASALYINLYFNEQYTDSYYEELSNHAGETIYDDGEELRKIISTETGHRYFDSQGLEQLLVINSQQEIADTLEFLHWEYYETMIESSYIATYQYKAVELPSIAISMEEFSPKKIKKSPVFQKDQQHLGRVKQLNNFQIDAPYYFASTQFAKDTISILAFGDHFIGKECLYLLRNYAVADSLINDYFIQDLLPIPLATTNEILYMTTAIVPETDIMWDQLMGIDVKNGRFKFYPKNRFNNDTNK